MIGEFAIRAIIFVITLFLGGWILDEITDWQPGLVWLVATLVALFVSLLDQMLLWIYCLVADE